MNLYGGILSRHMWTQKRTICASRSLKHVLKISDLWSTELKNVQEFANTIKKAPEYFSKSLKSRTLLMLFEKPSLRTQVSSETRMSQMGGYGIFYSIANSVLGKKETFGGTNQVRHKSSGGNEGKKKRVLVALGGNALRSAKQKGTNEEMFENTRESCRQMVKLIDNHNYQLIITHGNGPQVGSLFFQQQVSKDVTPALPLNVCGAMSQGQIGFMLQQCLYNELSKNGHKRHEQRLQDRIVTVVTQVVVDPKDPAWKQPSKPVGKFMSEEEALALQKEKGYFVMEDSGRGWRVAVASPKPIDIVEKNSIAQLCDDGYIVIASGGGGIPVVRSTEEPNTIEGRDAVIDKDLAAVLLGVNLRADVLAIATDIDGVYLNFSQKDKRKKVDKMTTAEAREYLKAGHFAKGSMAPKILAAIEFVEQTGNVCVIGSLNEIEQGIRGEKGTTIVPAN